MALRQQASAATAPEWLAARAASLTVGQGTMVQADHGPAHAVPTTPDEQAMDESSTPLSSDESPRTGAAPLSEVAPRLLLQQLDLLRVGTKLLQASLDPRTVHDMRVACRRSRVVLRVLDDLSLSAEIRNELRWASSLLAETRDLDILLKRLERWSTKQGRKAAHPAASAMDQVFDRVRSERLEAHGRLSAALASERYEALVEALAGLATKIESATASVPADEFGLKWIRKAAKPVRARLRKDVSDLKESELHRARQLLRRLRYVIEFFADCLTVEVQGVLKQLIRTQNALGALQDASVAGALLKTVTHNGLGTEPEDPALSSIAEAFAKDQSKRAKKTRKRLEKRWKQLRKAKLFTK